MEEPFALGPQRLAAGDQHAKAGAHLQQFLRRVRRGVDDVLAIVEHEQGGPAIGVLDGVLLHEGQGRKPLAPADRVRDLVAIAHRRQVDDPDAAGEILQQMMRRRQAQTGFANTAGTDEGHRAMLRQ